MQRSKARDECAAVRVCRAHFRTNIQHILLGDSKAALQELVPSLNKSMGERLARQFASLMDIDTSVGREGLKLRLKRLSKWLLENDDLRRKYVSSATSAEGFISVVEGHGPKPSNGATESPGPYHVLKNFVGLQKFNEILTVFQEIRHIRHCSALWTKFSPQHPPISSSNYYDEVLDVETDNDNLVPVQSQQAPISQEDEEDDRLPASKSLPAPISDIYFHTRLVEAMVVSDAVSCVSCIPPKGVPSEDHSQRCGCIVHRTNWDELLQDSKIKLAAFRKFEKENLKEGENLSFTCKSGVCCSFGYCPKK